MPRESSGYGPESPKATRRTSTQSTEDLRWERSKNAGAQSSHLVVRARSMYHRHPSTRVADSPRSPHCPTTFRAGSPVNTRKVQGPRSCSGYNPGTEPLAVNRAVLEDTPRKKCGIALRLDHTDTLFLGHRCAHGEGHSRGNGQWPDPSWDL